MAFRHGDTVRVISSRDYPAAVGKVGTIVDPDPSSIEWIALEGINSASTDALCGFPSFRASELAPADPPAPDQPAKKSSSWW
ncbi:hypothetical protein [Streptomyces sp. NPDC048644]|uniref:hypothetical protein n=1 Tax=Streptomyces sp. NPDC048644 TaxID=3365582 RepID=UPI00372170ED